MEDAILSKMFEHECNITSMDRRLNELEELIDALADITGYQRDYSGNSKYKKQIEKKSK